MYNIILLSGIQHNDSIYVYIANIFFTRTSTKPDAFKNTSTELV